MYLTNLQTEKRLTFSFIVTKTQKHKKAALNQRYVVKKKKRKKKVCTEMIWSPGVRVMMFCFSLHEKWDKMSDEAGPFKLGGIIFDAILERNVCI